jgi:hypothetical protein
MVASSWIREHVPNLSKATYSYAGRIEKSDFTTILSYETQAIFENAPASFLHPRRQKIKQPQGARGIFRSHSIPE